MTYTLRSKNSDGTINEVADAIGLPSPRSSARSGVIDGQIIQREPAILKPRDEAA